MIMMELPIGVKLYEAEWSVIGVYLMELEDSNILNDPDTEGDASMGKEVIKPRRKNDGLLPELTGNGAWVGKKRRKKRIKSHEKEEKKEEIKKRRKKERKKNSSLI